MELCAFCIRHLVGSTTKYWKLMLKHFVLPQSIPNRILQCGHVCVRARTQIYLSTSLCRLFLFALSLNWLRIHIRTNVCLCIPHSQYSRSLSFGQFDWCSMRIVKMISKYIRLAGTLSNFEPVHSYHRTIANLQTTKKYFHCLQVNVKMYLRVNLMIFSK